MKRLELERQINDRDGIEPALAWAKDFIRRGLFSGPVCLRLGRPRRTLDQNKKLWPMCEDVARQVQWHGQWMPKDHWKDLFTGSLRVGTPVPGIPTGEGHPGVVIVGGGSSKLTIREFTDLIEFIYSFGADHDVVWSEKSKESIGWMQQRRAA